MNDHHCGVPIHRVLCDEWDIRAEARTALSPSLYMSVKESNLFYGVYVSIRLEHLP